MAYGDSEWSSRDEKAMAERAPSSREVMNVKPSRWASKELARYARMFTDCKVLLMAEPGDLRVMVETLIQEASAMGLGAVYRPQNRELRFDNGALGYLVNLGDWSGLPGLRYDVAWVRGAMDHALHEAVAMGLNLDMPSRFIWED